MGALLRACFLVVNDLLKLLTPIDQVIPPTYLRLSNLVSIQY
jgi:hypothetical protein